MGIGSNAGDPTSALIELEVGRENEFLSKDSLTPEGTCFVELQMTAENDEKGPAPNPISASTTRSGRQHYEKGSSSSIPFVNMAVVTITITLALMEPGFSTSVPPMTISVTDDVDVVFDVGDKNDATEFAEQLKIAASFLTIQRRHGERILKLSH